MLALNRLPFGEDYLGIGGRTESEVGDRESLA
jgi:hypothetical protein